MLYNKHLSRSFLLNYGGTLPDPKEEAILKRVHDFSCEWLQRPNIAQTFQENMPLLCQYSRLVFVPEFLNDLLNYLEPMTDTLSHLDNKDKPTTEPDTRENTVSILRTIEPQLEDCVIQRIMQSRPARLRQTRLLRRTHLCGACGNLY